MVQSAERRRERLRAESAVARGSRLACKKSKDAPLGFQGLGRHGYHWASSHLAPGSCQHWHTTRLCVCLRVFACVCACVCVRCLPALVVLAVRVLACVHAVRACIPKHEHDENMFTLACVFSGIITVALATDIS